MKNIAVGVVGYCPPTKFDEVEAQRMIVEAYDKVASQFPEHEISIVSGLTNVGVLKIAYEEAAKRGWRTVGIACKLALNYERYPVDEEIIFCGENWGDESPLFVSHIQAIIRIGLGKQSLRETETVKERGFPAFEYDLPAL
jgi:hypothetical protein